MESGGEAAADVDASTTDGAVPNQQTLQMQVEALQVQIKALQPAKEENKRLRAENQSGRDEIERLRAEVQSLRKQVPRQAASPGGQFAAPAPGRGMTATTSYGAQATTYQRALSLPPQHAYHARSLTRGFNRASSKCSSGNSSSL